MKQITLIGDSIRMGYQSFVQAEMGDGAAVWGPEQNGGTSENVLAHLDTWVISRPADVVHINCGLHDLKKEFGQDAAAVPLDRYTDNVRVLLARVKEETGARVVWAQTTPVNEEWHHRNKPFDRFEADVLEYNAVAASICAELGIVVNDLYACIAAAERDSLLLPDGVHFKPEGYQLLGRTVADCIRSPWSSMT